MMRSISPRGWIAVATILCCAAGTNANESAPWRLVDVDGNVHTPFEDESVRAIALIFVSTDCPIANSYQPLLRRLAEKYESDGVRFFQVHCTAELATSAACDHRDEYKIRSPVLLDREQKLAKRVGARVTPEAVVVLRDGDFLAYRGRIDDRYATYGKKRIVATRNDLADSLDAIIAGKEVERRETKAVGCLISFTHQ